LCCALVLVGRETPVSLLSGVPGDTRVVAASITGTLFGRDLQLAGASRKRNVAYGLPVRFKAGMMLDDEDEPADDEESADKDSEEPAEEDGGESGDEYAKFVWRKERLEKDWGVNTDTWLDPGLLGNIDYKDGPFTAGHRPADENVTNTTTQFVSDDWTQLNGTTNETWIDDDDFRWNSPYDYVGARPLVVDHHHVVDHHRVKFLPGVNINSNPLCGQNMDGSPIDCGDSEWNV